MKAYEPTKTKNLEFSLVGESEMLDATTAVTNFIIKTFNRLQICYYISASSWL